MDNISTTTTTTQSIDTINNEPLLITTNNQEQTIIIINNDLTTTANTLVPITTSTTTTPVQIMMNNETTEMQNANNTNQTIEQFTSKRKRAIDIISSSYNGDGNDNEEDCDENDSNDGNQITQLNKHNKQAKKAIINGNSISIDNQVTVESTPTLVSSSSSSTSSSNQDNTTATTTTTTNNNINHQHHHYRNDAANTDEIFQLLSQKIAKYCQVLSDLTNGEVFFKSSLNQRTLYWGTYKMMFNYSHQGLQYDRNDSLIKISGRSLSNDITNIVDELIGVDTNDDSLSAPCETETPTTAAATIRAAPALTSVSNTTNNDLTSNFSRVMLKNDLVDNIENIEFKECVIYADRLNDNIYDEYLNKFEKNRVFNDSYLNQIQNLSANDKNDSNLNDSEHDQNNDDLHTCEHCSDYSTKHLPELKLHVLKEHEKIPFKSEAPFECAKCKLNIDKCDDYLNHLLLCYYPDLYTCKICNHNFDAYSDYYCHTKYIHTQAYACSLCRRRFKNVKELTEHDELMHSKSLNFCELCFEQMKSRNDLQEHYKTKHIKLANQFEHKLIRGVLQQQQQLQLQSVSRNDSIVSDKDEYMIDSSLDASSIIVKNKDDDLNLTANSINNSEEQQQSSLLNKSLNSSKVQKSDLIRGLLDRKHQCKWCTLRFFTKSQLKQHESTHVNAVLYCPVCDKEFTHKDRLAGHMKCHMEPSLECKICGKKFKRLCNLYNHELVHGLTEHAFMLCQFCGRGFRSRRDYQNHVIANHRDQLMKSEVIMKNGSNNNVNTATNATNEQKTTQSTPIINRTNKLNDLTNESIASQSSDGEIERSDNQDNDEKECKQDKHVEQHSYGLRSNRKSTNLSNTHLLVQAAEFVQNQTL